MSNLQIFTILAGIMLTVLIAWYFWFAPKAQTRAAVAESGAQEVAITVKGGYTPDVIVVQKGRLVRLTFMPEKVGSMASNARWYVTRQVDRGIVINGVCNDET